MLVAERARQVHLAALVAGGEEALAELALEAARADRSGVPGLISTKWCIIASVLRFATVPLALLASLV